MRFSYEIPNLDDVWSMADWVEFYIVYNAVDFSKSEFQNFIEGTTGNDCDEKELASIDSVWDEIERREVLYGTIPPFKIDGSVIRCNLTSWSQQPHYCMCLIFSLEGNDHVEGYTPLQSGSLFEEVIKLSTKFFFSGTAYIFGFPNETLEEFASKISLVNFLQNLHPDQNDGGMDVLGTGPFNDGRRNNLSIIIQCAAGYNWKSKTSDVIINEWVKKLDFPVVPVSGFAVPIIMKKRDVDKRSTRMGLLIDRPRIYRSLVEIDFALIKPEIEKWCNDRLSQMIANEIY